MKEKVLGLISVALLAWACNGDPERAHEPDIDLELGDSEDLDQHLDSDDADGGEEEKILYLNNLNGLSDLWRLGVAGGAVKYLAAVDGRSQWPPLTAACTFQNMNLHVWHFTFLRTFEAYADLTFEAYTDLVLRDPSRIWWAGDVRFWSQVPHPRGGIGVIAYSVYGESEGGPEALFAHLLEVDARLKSCMPNISHLLAFLPTEPPQQEQTLALQDRLADQGVAVVYPRDLAQGVPFEVYSEGIAYGTLQVIPLGERLRDYGLRDVVVTQSAPNDIGIVAALVTAELQNPASHVNLRLVEKGIPNAALPSIYSQTVVQTLAGQLVRLQADENGVEMRAADYAEAAAFWESRRPVVPTPRYDLEVRELYPFGEMPEDAARFCGAKAENLGHLYRILEPEHRQDGFCIPFAWYHQHIVQNGIVPMITRLANEPRMHSDAAYRRSMLKDLRNRIRQAPVDPTLRQAIVAALQARYGAEATHTKMRFRSSTNVEDLVALTGAGLYDSRSGCLGDDLQMPGPSRCLDGNEEEHLRETLALRLIERENHPERYWLDEIINDIERDLERSRPIEDALRAVWASLWNDRAFVERSYYGIAHTDAFMGLAVHPAFVLEEVNAVAITELDESAQPLYRVVSQHGAESVVRPADPTAVAEVMTFRRGAEGPVEMNVQINSSLVEGNLWREDEAVALARLLFTIQDAFAAEVYPELRPLSLDVEIKGTRDRHIVLKQARPYVRDVSLGGP